MSQIILNMVIASGYSDRHRKKSPLGGQGINFISRLERAFKDFYLWTQVNVCSVGVEINPHRCQTHSNREDVPLSTTIKQDSQVSGRSRPQT